jgi:putative oxidoreductase
MTAMSDLQLTIEEKETFVDIMGRWIPRSAVALLFLAPGWSKFSAHGVWVRMFDQIGLGQWLRVFTGALQVGGAVLLLIPRVS